MKKLEKKSGRRASRKRERMERLLQEVAPERDGSGQQALVTAKDKERDEFNPENMNASHQSSRRGQTGLSTSQFIAQAKEPNPAAPETPKAEVESIDSRSAARRRRRMQRIRTELRQHGVSEPTVQQTHPHDAATIAHNAAEAARQITEAPKEDNSPTAQSMVAIAGAVTALASAIQFRLTDRPEDASHRRSSNKRRKSPKRFQASQGFASKSTTNSVPVDSTQVNVESADDASNTDSVPDQEPSTSQPSKDFAHKERGTKSSKQSLLAAAAVDLSESNHLNDSNTQFEDSFFDDDESDVAGAYTVLPPVQQPVESYRDWFQRVVVKNKWMTWFTAFYVHWLILLFMMMIFVHGPDQAANLLLNGAFADSPEIETESFEMTVAEPEARPKSKAEPAAAEPVSERMSLDQMAEESVAISDSLLQQFSDNAAEDSGEALSEQTTPNQEAHAPRTPEGSVSQGSFSVWTEPEYPDPGEPYRIIVQIQLPPKTTNYHLRDLNGVVVGSDGYRKPIPGPNPKPLPVVDGCVRLVIPIVSADEKVRDTIFIRSKLLKETQKLLIEF